MSTSVQDNHEVLLDIYTFVDSTKTFTVVNIFTDKDGVVVEGIGVAKRNAEDEYDQTEGYNIATKRALIDLADKFSEY